MSATHEMCNMQKIRQMRIEKINIGIQQEAMNL
jgi:hypothetical protein